MRQILAIFLVLALIGSTLANVRDHNKLRKRPARDARPLTLAKRKAVSLPERFRSMGKGGEARRDYVEARALHASEKLGMTKLDSLRNSFVNGIRPDRERLTGLRDQMARGAKHFAEAAGETLNAKPFKKSMQKSLKRRPRP